MEEGEGQEMNEKIPYVAIGNDEIDEKAKPRIDELFKTCKSNKEDGIKLLSLLLSRGKTEKGKVITCGKCESMYLVFPEEIGIKKCKCGEILK